MGEQRPPQLLRQIISFCQCAIKFYLFLYRFIFLWHLIFLSLSHMQTLMSVNNQATTCVTMSVWTQSAASCVAVTAATFWHLTDTRASPCTTVSWSLWRSPSETFACVQTDVCMLSSVMRGPWWESMIYVTVGSPGKADTLMSAGTCSFTCQDFINMKSSLLQLKLKLGNMQSPNQVTCQHFCSTLKTAQPLVGVQQMLHHLAKENKIVSFLFGPMCFRCLVWPTAAINHQWAEQERVLIDLVFQALLVLQELLVSQVMLKYTHSFSFINLDGAGVSVVLVVPCIWL